MDDERRRWDERYRGEEGRSGAADSFVAAVLEGLARGEPTTLVPASGAAVRALDLASGTGRHALELARRGFAVEAWDVSEVGLSILRARAAAEGLCVVTRAQDLREELPAAARSGHDLVLCVDYLERSLLPRVAELLVPRGLFLFTTFTADHPGEHPSARFRLARGELTAGLPGLETLLLEEAGGRVGWLARRPAG